MSSMAHRTTSRPKTQKSVFVKLGIRLRTFRKISLLTTKTSEAIYSNYLGDLRPSFGAWKRLLVQLSSSETQLDTILLSLEGSVHRVVPVIMRGVDMMREMGLNMMCIRVQSLNTRRKVLETKEDMVGDMLRVLLLRRRRRRTEEVRDATRVVSGCLKAAGRVKMAVTTGHLAHAVELAQGALEVPIPSNLLLFVAARDLMRTVPVVLTSAINNVVMVIIKSHGAVCDYAYADVVMACVCLQVSVPLSSFENLTSRICENAIMRIRSALRDLKQFGLDERVGFFCRSVLETMRIVDVCTKWHGTIAPLMSRRRGKISSSSIALKNIGQGLEKVSACIWQQATSAILSAIAETPLLVSNQAPSPNSKHTSRLIHIALALESLRLLRHFVAPMQSQQEVLRHHITIRERVGMPLLQRLRAEALDKLHHMLTQETWNHVQVAGGVNDPRETFKGSALRLELEQALSSVNSMEKTSLMRAVIRNPHGCLSRILLLDDKHSETMYNEMTLVATRAAIAGFHQLAVDCVFAAVLVEGTGLYALEILFGLFETYLAAVTVAHLPAKVGRLPCDSPSTQLDKFLALAVKTPPKASELKDVEEAVTGAESLVFCSEVLSPAAKLILKFDVKTEDSKYNIANERLKHSVELAMDLRSSILKAIGSRLVDMSTITQTIANIKPQVWLGHVLQEECNKYVSVLVKRLSSLWRSLDTSVDCELFSSVAKQIIWTQVVQNTFEALVDGIALVKQCSTAGRALMSMDLHVLQFSLDKIHIAKPTRGVSYVDSYIKAWYFENKDLETWITQNEHNYSQHHLDALRKSK